MSATTAPAGGDDGVEDGREALVFDKGAEAQEAGVVRPRLIQRQAEEPEGVDLVAQLLFELAITQVIHVLQDHYLEHDFRWDADPALWR